MSTTTPNLNLTLPSVGDGIANGQPWGNTLNGNFTIIDGIASTDTDKGDSLVAVKSSLTGGVARDQHKKNMDLPTTKDLGLIPDMTVDSSGYWVTAGATDNSLAATALFKNHQLKKHHWTEGSYYNLSGITYNYDEVAGLYGITNRIEIVGDGKTNTHIVAGGPGASFTASAYGTKLTLLSSATGNFAIGQILAAVNVDFGTTIMSLDSGTLGLIGSTYTLSVPASVNIATESMTTQVHGLGFTGSGYQTKSTFSGSVTGSTLTLSSTAVGTFALGDPIFCAYVPTGTTVASKTSGTLGQTGSVYALSAPASSPTGTVAMRTADRAGAGVVGLNKISNLSIDNASGDHLTNVGLMLNCQSNAEIEDVMITGFGTGVTYNGASGGLFRNVAINYSTNGITGASVPLVSDNNLLLFDRVFFGNCTNYGLDMTLGTNTMFLNCDWEGCGCLGGVPTYTAGTGNSGACRLTISNTSGMNGPVFENCYIEANNGTADIEIINLNYSPITITFRNCNFMRLSSAKYTTNCIKVTSPNARCTVLLENCSFACANSFSTDFAGSGMWTKNPISHDANTDVIRIGGHTNNINMYGHTPMWTGTPGSFLPVRGGLVNADGTYGTAGPCDGTWTSQKITTTHAAGHYRITSTSSKGFTDDPAGAGYLPWAIGNDGTNAKIVLNTCNATQTTFDVFTGTGVGNWSDCAFSWFLIKIV